MLLKRAIIGSTFALIFGLVTFSVSQAQTIPEAYGSDDCGDCHGAVSTQWEDSVHGHASLPETYIATSPEKETDCFRCDLTEIEESGGHGNAGMTCDTCHPSNPAEHPQKIMQTDISSQMCGECHVETLAEWETSLHGQEDISCARCHNPHSNELRAGTMQDTCRSCHKEETHFFTFTAHAEGGLLCTDCHLQAKSEPQENGLSQHSHTFLVDSNTCAACHNDEMHQPGEASAMVIDEPMMMQASFLPARNQENSALQSEPSANSPYNFAIMAGLIGMAFGLVGSPWLERWQMRLRAQENGGNDEY